MNGFFRRHRVFILTESIAAVLIAALLLWQNAVTGALDSQAAAARWRAGDMRFAQVGTYIANGSGMTREQIYTLRDGIDNALLQASVTAETSGARLWYDAWCGFGTLTLKGPHASVSAAVTGVGGDFFRIHNWPLRSGYYFSEADVTADRVVLDATAAWQLFGSSDVAGLEIRIGERPLVVAGVVELPDNPWETAAYGDTPRIYMNYDTLAEYQTMEITCYEAVLPDPVSGFAKALLEKQLPVGETNRAVIECSDRYRMGTLLNLARNFAQSRIVSVPVVYPWWENAARVTEAQAALLQLLWLVLCIVPAAGLCVLAVRAWKGRRLHFADIPEYYERARAWIDEKKQRISRENAPRTRLFPSRRNKKEKTNEENRV